MTTNNATHLTALSVLKTPSATNSPALSKMSKSIKALIHIPAISGFFDLSFDKLSNFDISYIVPLTSDISIHAELASHISQLSGTLGRERRGVVGGDNGETVSETLARARDLSSDRIQVVHGGLYLSVAEFDECTVCATGNLPNVALRKSQSVNVYELLRFNKLVFTKEGLDLFIERLG